MNKEGFKALKKDAERGDAQAQFDLGCCYAMGDGVKKNLKEAVRWFKKSAEQGHPIAQFSLGFHYANGDGVTKDLKKAKELFDRANGSRTRPEPAERCCSCCSCCFCSCHR